MIYFGIRSDLINWLISSLDLIKPFAKYVSAPNCKISISKCKQIASTILKSANVSGKAAKCWPNLATPGQFWQNVSNDCHKFGEQILKSNF